LGDTVNPAAPAAYAELRDGRLRLRLKVVPGASRSRVVGLLGDRLKVQVAVPPVDGAANRAVRQCLAAWLGISETAVEVLAGHNAPLKLLGIPADTRLPPAP
jgi:hypothetical protein